MSLVVSGHRKIRRLFDRVQLVDLQRTPVVEARAGPPDYLLRSPNYSVESPVLVGVVVEPLARLRCGHAVVGPVEDEVGRLCQFLAVHRLDTEEHLPGVRLRPERVAVDAYPGDADDRPERVPQIADRPL